MDYDNLNPPVIPHRIVNGAHPSPMFSVAVYRQSPSPPNSSPSTMGQFPVFLPECSSRAVDRDADSGSPSSMKQFPVFLPECSSRAVDRDADSGSPSSMRPIPTILPECSSRAVDQNADSGSPSSFQFFLRVPPGLWTGTLTVAVPPV